MPNPTFAVVERGAWPESTPGIFTLIVDNWDDYHFRTSYSLHYGRGHDTVELGAVKIAPRGMAAYDPHTQLPKRFERLEDHFFSLGQDREYYEALMELPKSVGSAALSALRDVAHNAQLFEQVRHEEVFSTSLLRSVPLRTVTTQFRRIAHGKAPLTEYRFSYTQSAVASMAPPLQLNFGITPEATPPTNVHVLIGANGVGKSHLLQEFVAAAAGETEVAGKFRDELASPTSSRENVPFANVVHVAFSAFDRRRDFAERGSSDFVVHPVGLSELQAESLDEQFASSLTICSKGPRKSRWLAAVATLSAADGIIADASLHELLGLQEGTVNKALAREQFESMSSGHKIALLTVTKLVELVEERSLVLLDEPETHLHPPLLSALTRAVSDLVIDRNGVAIVATHSPVVLQEVPRTCVWALRRSGADVRASRLSSETFGESVSRLTSEVFHLDVNRTGYHAVLQGLLERHGGSTELVLGELGDQLGAEGRLVLSALGRWWGDSSV